MHAIHSSYGSYPWRFSNGFMHKYTMKLRLIFARKEEKNGRRGCEEKI